MTQADISRLLASRKTEDRIRGIGLLRRSEDAQKQALLLKTLDDRSHYVAALAAEALAECADWDSAQAMLEAFLHLSEDGRERDPGCHIRAYLAFALGRLEYSLATDALRIGIRTVQIEPVGGVPFDTGAHLRANCALALAQIHAPDAVRDIALLLFDTSGNSVREDHNASKVKVEPRKAAAQALSRLGDAAGLIPLTLRLVHSEGEEAEVLQECMLALVELEDPRALEILPPYLHHRDQLLAAYAALMIARTRAPEAPALLKEAIARFSGNALQATVLALSTLRTDEAQAILHALAADERQAVRLAVVEALSSSPDESNRSRLQQMASQDSSAPVRDAAQRALAS